MKNDPWSCERSLCNHCILRSFKKSRTSTLCEDSNPWPHDTGATLLETNCYEATDVGSWSIMCSCSHERDEYDITHIWELQKWNQMNNDPRSCEHNLGNKIKCCRPFEALTPSHYPFSPQNRQHKPWSSWLFRLLALIENPDSYT